MTDSGQVAYGLAMAFLIGGGGYAGVAVVLWFISLFLPKKHG